MDAAAAGENWSKKDLILDIGENQPDQEVYVEIEEIITWFQWLKAIPRKKVMSLDLSGYLEVPGGNSAREAGADIVNDITGFLGDPKMAVSSRAWSQRFLMFNPVMARPYPDSLSFQVFGGLNQFSEQELLGDSEPIQDLMWTLWPARLQ